MSNKIGWFFEILWPSQNIWILLTIFMSLEIISPPLWVVWAVVRPLWPFPPSHSSLVSSLHWSSSAPVGSLSTCWDSHNGSKYFLKFYFYLHKLLPIIFCILKIFLPALQCTGWDLPMYEYQLVEIGLKDYWNYNWVYLFHSSLKVV